jgi:DNA-binding NtrC family response regulator
MMDDSSERPILLIDDEQNILRGYEIVLKMSGFSPCLLCSDSRKAMDIIKEHNPRLILLDLIMPHKDGFTLLKEIMEERGDIPVIIITGVNEVAKAVECIKEGAFDYLVKPLSRDRLVITIRNALNLCEITEEHNALKEKVFSEQLGHPDGFSDFITSDKKVLAILNYAETIAKTDSPVFISGETGTGKELIARGIHRSSKRGGDFICVNVAGLDDQMFSDTLFGHKKGAFTGAIENRAGLIRRAENGVLFLDEIGDMPLQSQVKLLRLIQEHEYSPLGEDNIFYSTARIIVASNKNIEECIEKGSFRKDLYYRLSHHHIQIPPLRERSRTDLSLLLKFFVYEASKKLDAKLPVIPEEITLLLSGYSFPGNIRELQALIFDCMAQHQQEKTLPVDYFKNYLSSKGCLDEVIEKARSEGSLVDNNNIIFPKNLPSLKVAISDLVKEAMKRASSNQTLAASMLGISQQALNYRLKTIKKNIENDL